MKKRKEKITIIQNKKALLFVIVLLIILVILVICLMRIQKSDSGNNLNESSCKIDSDCVPKECCHPTSCTNIANKSACNLLCTQECKNGTLDCGQGSCGCINNKCKVK